MSDFAAKPTSDATLVHRRDRIDFKRIARRFNRERRATGEPNTGVIAGTDILIDAIAYAHEPLAAL